MSQTLARAGVIRASATALITLKILSQFLMQILVKLRIIHRHCLVVVAVEMAVEAVDGNLSAVRGRKKTNVLRQSLIPQRSIGNVGAQ